METTICLKGGKDGAQAESRSFLSEESQTTVHVSSLNLNYFAEHGNYTRAYSKV